MQDDFSSLLENNSEMKGKLVMVHIHKLKEMLYL